MTNSKRLCASCASGGYRASALLYHAARAGVRRGIRARCPLRPARSQEDLSFVRTLYLILQILLAPFVLLNLMICVAGVTTVLGVSHDSSLLLMILAVVLGIGAWGLNGATVRVLTGNAPTWMRLLWLPGLLFSVVVTFDTYLSPSGATMLKLVWPPELPAMSVLKFVVLSAFAVVTVGSTTAIILLERLRKAAA
jgi:hypothetical protein